MFNANTDDVNLYYRLNNKKQLDNTDNINDFDNYEEYQALLASVNNITIDKSVNTNNKRKYCYNCGKNDVTNGFIENDIIEDTTQGTLICSKCGYVISSLLDAGPEWTHYNDDNKKDANRHCHVISQLLPQTSLATRIMGSCASRIKTLHGWSAIPYKERSLNDVFKIMQKKCTEGKILKCIEDDAKIMYKNISNCKHIGGKNKDKTIIIRGKNRISLIAACILNSCRKKDKTRSPKEIAELFGLKNTEITKGYKIFQKLAKIKGIDINFNTTKPEHFIVRFCEELKIKTNYAKQAIQIANNAMKLQIAAVHTPLSIATGSLYLMIFINNLQIQKKTIAEKFNVSQVTIAKAFKKLEPFMNLLIDDDKCNRIAVEIKKYQDDITIDEFLKPKFLRFNVDVEKDLGFKNEDIYGVIIKESSETNIKINTKLIMLHNFEIENKIKEIDNEYIKLKLTYSNMIHNDANNLFTDF